MLALLFNILKQSLLKTLKSGHDLTCFGRALIMQHTDHFYILDFQTHRYIFDGLFMDSHYLFFLFTSN